MSRTHTEPNASLVKPLTDLCRVCQRPIWGDVARLGHGQWRHEECRPGSKAWLESKPVDTRTQIDQWIANGA